MNNEEQPVIFHEGGVSKAHLQYVSPQTLEGETSDRMIKLLMKISGGRIKSVKTARKIILILIIAMVAISVYWFFAG